MNLRPAISRVSLIQLKGGGGSVRSNLGSESEHGPRQEVISTDSFDLWGCDTYLDDAAPATTNRWVNHSKHHREESKGRYDGLCKMNLAGSLYLTFLSRVANRSDTSVMKFLNVDGRSRGTGLYLNEKLPPRGSTRPSIRVCGT